MLNSSVFAANTLLNERKNSLVFYVRKIPTKKRGDALFYFFCQLVIIKNLESYFSEFEAHDNKYLKGGSIVSKKKLISEIELLNILNNELEKHPEYKVCHFNSVQRIIPDSPSDCNWSGAWKNCGGPPPVGWEHVASKIVTEAQAKYNLK